MAALSVGAMVEEPAFWPDDDCGPVNATAAAVRRWFQQ